MEKQQLAALMLKAMGGAENLVKMSYCASRIRVKIRDTSRLDRRGLESLDDIKSVLDATRRSTTPSIIWSWDREIPGHCMKH